jgi:putative FmdB family regulatory protein
MPIFEYQCPECTGIIEYMTLDSDEKVLCPIDDAPMTKLISAPKGYVKGSQTPCRQGKTRY